jgi:hypothetical protein
MLSTNGIKVKYDGNVYGFQKFSLKSGPKLHKVGLFGSGVGSGVLINYYYYNYIS